MTNAAGTKRTDSASRVIKASPQSIYQAFLNADAVATWRPPEGMKARIYMFDAREGGTYRMAFEYSDARHDVRGKSKRHAEAVW
jgi:uncharacterized protein YndB with AHSA1/START domain